MWRALVSASSEPPLLRNGASTDSPRLDESTAFTASFSLRLPSSSAPLAVGLVWSGRGFEGGQVARRDGELRVRTSLSDLRRLPVDAAEELFLLTCQPSTRHAAMYWELGWPSGIHCPMVFHADPAEYVADLVRIQDRARTYCESLWELAGGRLGLAEDDRFLKQFDDASAISAFVRDLERRRTSGPGLSRPEVVEVLRRVRDEQQPSLGLHELGEQRLALCARPIDLTRPSAKVQFRSVWVAYAALSDAVWQRSGQARTP